MEAVEAAVEVAREQGIRVDEPVVLRDLTNVLVRLDPSPLVARVPMTLSRLRGRDWFERELHAVSWLAQADAPVAPPASAVDPGPHERDGFLVTLWDALDHNLERFDAVAGGLALRDLHAVFASYPKELPAFDRLDEIDRLLRQLQPSDLVSEQEIEGMLEVRALLATEPLPPLRPLHGDAHFGNVLWTPDGPRFTDFENLCAGPVEYDLACISWRDRPENPAALEAYGAHDEQLRALMEPYLALFLAPWTVLVVERRSTPAGIEEARRRVARALEPLRAPR
jgi:aminoglycoside phosphotransferase (APT) family kinase protein